ncbi:MAG TPA: tetratricopeptide repeat protein [Pirellulales bacterium]
MAGREVRRKKTAPERLTSQTPPSPRLRMPSGAGQFLLAIAVLSGLGAMVYGPALHSPFIFDDFHSVVLNPSITKLWPLFGASGPLAPPAEAPTAGRPLVNLSLAINYQFGQLDPFGYHVLNLTLHVLSALLLWGIVRRTLQLPYFEELFDRETWIVALLVAVAWLVHPLQTEAVEYVTQRTELMMGFFYLATLYGSLRYFCAETSAQRALWLVAAGAACLLGVTCKEVMVTAPVAVLLFERTFITGSFLHALRRSWPLYLLLVLSWLPLLIFNLNAPRSESAGFQLGVPAHAWWFTQAKVLAMYLKLVVWPWPLSIHYHLPLLETVATAWPWLGLAGLLAIGTIVLVWRGSSIGFLGACVFMILAPTFAIPIVKEVAVERRMYLPLAAILTLFIVGAYWLLRTATQSNVSASNDPQSDPRPLRITIIFFSVAAIAMCLVSALRLKAYQDAVTIWQDAALRDPDDAMARNNVGRALIDAQRPAEASEYMRQFLKQAPDSAEGHHVLALALLNLNQPLEAIEHLNQALQGPDASLAHYHLGIAFMNSSRPEEAIKHFEAAARGQPEVAEIQNRLGMALTLAGRPQLALEHFKLAVKLSPDSPTIRVNLALALKAIGSLPEASHELEEIIRMAPDDVDARFQLAMLYGDLGRTDDAIVTAEKALELAKATGNLAKAQFIEGWLQEHRKRG